MITDFIQNLYRYNTWANQRILDSAAGASLEQLRSPAGLPFDSVLANLAHIMDVQWLWLQRWQGNSPTGLPDPAGYPDLSAIQSRWEGIESATQAFLAACTDAGLERAFSYRNFRGQEWAYPLWQPMLHQANHATQHRSEAAVALSSWGFSPGSMDFLFGLDALQSQLKK